MDSHHVLLEGETFQKDGNGGLTKIVFIANYPFYTMLLAGVIIIY
jgi:hypothetical protein